MLSGQALVFSMGRRSLASQVKAVGGQVGYVISKVDDLERTLPEMITRAEVERAFAQVAQIEAQKQAAAQQQARVQAVFGNGAAPADMNTAINAQLTSLSERINRINQEFGVG
jgi:lysophospholipase L1-like esterase